MTINEIITILKKTDYTAKLEVIHRLEHMSRQDLLELQRGVKERLALFCEK